MPDKDVLEKADALLRRHSSGAVGADTGSVPVLTELVAPAAAPKATAAADDIDREVCDRVMAEVESRLSTELERRIIHALVPQVHASVASAMRELHRDLAASVGKAVREALERRHVK